MSYIIKKAVQERVRELGKECGSDFPPAIDRMVEAVIVRVCKNCKGKRVTAAMVE